LDELPEEHAVDVMVAVKGTGTLKKKKLIIILTAFADNLD
jgi:hypothetical protein